MAKTEAISNDRQKDNNLRLWEMFQHKNQVQQEQQSKQINCVWTYSGGAYNS